jgi:phage T7 capsid assembly protein
MDTSNITANMTQQPQQQQNSIYPPNSITGNEDDAANSVEFINDGKKETLTQNQETQQEKQQTQQQNQQTEQQQLADVDKAIEQHDKSIADIKGALESKGVDFDAIREEYDENLELSADTYKNLEKAGYPKEAVDLMLEGIQSTVNKFVDAVYTHVGGEANFRSIQDFVAAQGDAEVSTFDSIMGCKNIHVVNSYLDGIKARMTLAHGSTGNTLITGGASAGGGGNTGAAPAFQSDAEMVAAMSDPRYTKDAAYRRQVQQRVLASSQIFG